MKMKFLSVALLSTACLALMSCQANTDAVQVQEQPVVAVQAEIAPKAPPEQIVEPAAVHVPEIEPTPVTFSAVIEYTLGDPLAGEPDVIKYTRGPFVSEENCRTALILLGMNAVADGGKVTKLFCE